MPEGNIILALIGLGALYAVLFGGLAYAAKTDPYGEDYGAAQGVVFMPLASLTSSNTDSAAAGSSLMR